MTDPIVNVAFLPIYPNPYQSQLADAVEANGARVQMLPTMPTAEWLRQNSGTVQVLHLHWLYGIYMGRWQTPRRLASFWRGLGLAQRLGYRTVWTAHNILPHRTELRPLHQAVRARVMRDADAVIVHCRYGETELRNRYSRAGPISVIPIGNMIGQFPLTMHQAEARSIMGLRPDQYVYLFLGLLAPYKGVDLLIDAFHQAASADDVLVIAGRSLDRAVTHQIEDAARADPRIRLYLGHVPDSEMQHFLLSADVLVAPYRAVLTSSSAILGLSYGLPVIAPALGCLPELVPPDAGSLYDPTQANSLSAALVGMKQRDAAALRAAALDRAEQLDWDSIGQRTVDVYRACLETIR